MAAHRDQEQRHMQRSAEGPALGRTDTRNLHDTLKVLETANQR